jgi:hypothetical protein
LLLILAARPAAGKSEIILYFKQTPIRGTQARFQIGEPDVIDDFPMLRRAYQ